MIVHRAERVRDEAGHRDPRGDPPDLVGIDDINSQLFIYHKVFTDLTPLVGALPEKDKPSASRRPT